MRIVRQASRAEQPVPLACRRLQLMEGCLDCSIIVWTTLMLSPKTVTRWAAGERLPLLACCIGPLLEDPGAAAGVAGHAAARPPAPGTLALAC